MIKYLKQYLERRKIIRQLRMLEDSQLEDIGINRCSLEDVVDNKIKQGV